MSWLHVFASRIQGIFSKRRLERELDDELRSHIEMLAEENVRKGISPKDALYAARRAFGSVEQTKEVYRERRGFALVETFVQDVRYGLRMLRRSPAFTAAAVFTLALGIGANTTIFTIVDAVMLKMLPVKNPSELVQLSRYYQDQISNFSYPWYEQLRDQNHTSSGVFAVSNNSPSKVRIGQETENIDCQYVTGNYYAVLGVNAAIGRVITREDDKITGSPAEPVAVLSYGFWRKRFGSDPSVIGRTIYVEKVPFTIVGVMLPEFFGVETGRAPSITIPMATERRIRPRVGWLTRTPTGSASWHGSSLAFPLSRRRPTSE